MAEDWVVRHDGEGTPVLRYLPGEREGRPWADLLEVLDESVDAAGYIRAELPGWVVSGSPELGQRLVADGATVLRHAHTFRRDLRADPPPADWAGAPLREGLRAVPCDRAPEDLFPAWRAAFGPGHVDHFHADDARALAERLGLLLAGKAIGPVLPSSVLAVDAEDRVLGAAILTDRNAQPWVGEVFRHPELGYRGLGADLLRRAVADAAARGVAGLGLAVSEGNPARHLYESLGFVLQETSLTVLVPDAG
ncbi:acetyltransferase (GNAT) family protein [Streptomyces sp. 1114.5]|uniref:GNAT family N-acetyltransferase n=1 Tax=Streptomyces sp. 1114.5 TaxID=1938830 RepID=UPI000EB0A58D|nr:GNAT family N-acetyltransferase [Streptomyces sp. 1114.5]RKT18706.1 acetyltransferase (GNAT) family protein [Streptomyces sp. 1114.5]